MLFNSFEFLVFFPIAVAVYFLLPRKIKYLWLLACSYYFYMGWNAKYALLLFASTAITFVSGVLIECCEKKELPTVRKKWVVAGSFILNLSMLVYFKYAEFFMSTVDRGLGLFGAKPLFSSVTLDIVLPVGISFYIFQALSYTIDVYRGDIKAEKNFFKYALFVSFFPQLVAGPIERSGNLLRQVNEIDKRRMWSYEGIIKGLILMLWGMFIKVVVAERLSIVVDAVFSDYEHQGSTMLLVACMFFLIQVYCDFSGYSMIAIGAAKVMGFSLMENFITPFFAHTVKEYWATWHISLGTWFRDYLYFPLGGSRCSKARNYFNLMVTFLVSGLWHGAAAKYVLWGGIMGAYQVVGKMTEGVRNKILDTIHVKKTNIVYQLLQIVCTFLLITSTMVVFRSNNLSEALKYTKCFLTKWDFTAFFRDKLFTSVVSERDMIILLISIGILLVVDLIRKFKKQMLDEYLWSKCYPIRLVAVMSLLFYVLVFGQYGVNVFAQPFVYFQF